MPKGGWWRALGGAAMLAAIGCGGSSPVSDAGDAGTIDGSDASPPLSAHGAAVAYQIDVAHTGSQPDSTLTPPLTKRWSIELNGPVSYPLIAGGRVFVTVGVNSTYGTKLHAIDLSSGKPSWGPIDIQGSYAWSNAAYDQGRIYVVNFDGIMTAFDAETGAQGWQVKLPDQFKFTSPPTATGGFVFVGGAGTGGTVYAVDGATGVVTWTAPVENGDNSSPAVSADAVYVGYSCVQAYAFSPAGGAPLWHHTTGCSGGGGATIALYGGRVWARDLAASNMVLDAATGAELGGFAAGPIPAFSGNLGFFLFQGTLQARTVDLASTKWGFAGDGMIVSAPIVVNGAVYAGSSSGTLYAIDAGTGRMLWSDAVGAPIAAPDEINLIRPLTGLAAGENALVVPADTLLVCYQ